ncbi:site-specific integrase [Xanthomarina sp. GH4-25]|uniref:tyrosine-type recombinase/integrase n=1 Tax=Xanthomarina sp. GH4-25 TaxID=3349335 RepID=UPI000D678ABA|nr:integrase [Flavobacteriaceae bacterium LYZ1037]
MQTLNDFLIFEHENKCFLEHDLSHKKTFSPPKIYLANGDLNRRWYVYFSFRNPKTGKLERQKNIYGIANKLRTKTDRLNILNHYKKSLHRLLKEGYDPYKDNLDRFLANKPKACSNMSPKKIVPAPIIEKEKVTPYPFIKRSVSTTQVLEVPKAEPLKVISTVKEVEPIIVPEPINTVEPENKDETKMSLREAFDFALTMKEKLVKPRTLQDYRNRSKVFIKWLNEEYPNVIHANQITRKISMDFLNHHLIKNTPRSRNNCRVDLSSMMQVLEDNEIIPVNVIRKTPVLKAKPERHKRYNPKTLEAIFEYLKKEDPTLLLYIQFISYNFMRPIEVCRLKVKDLNLETKTLSFQAKNSPLKTKIIPEIILDVLPDISKLPKENALITPDGIGKVWDTQTDNKRDYFSKRFKKIVKTKFNLGTDYGLYSFRHTFITKLYRKLVENSSPFEAKSVLMNITGHTSMVALEKYLRDIDAHLPTDYSDLIR